MKKLVSAVLMVMTFVFLFSSAASFAYAPDVNADEPSSSAVESGKCGNNAYWSYSADGTLTISGTGETYTFNYYQGQMPWLLAGCEPIKKIVVEEGITFISEHLFYNLTALKEVSLPESLIYLWSYAFSGDTALEYISIPRNVREIGRYCFSGCTSLKHIEFEGDRALFLNGVFYGCTSLESIRFPGQMGYVGHEAFKYCRNLKTVYLSSVTNVEYGAFAYCDSLTDVYYPGSKDAWDKIEKPKYNDPAFSNEQLWKADIHYYYKYNFMPHCKVSELKYSVYAYTGKPVKPSFDVYTASGTKLTKGKHYTVKYTDNVKCGEATVMVIGMGKYYGTKYFTFRINYRKVQDLKIIGSTGTTAKISWKPSSGAVEYEVKVGANSKYTAGNTFTVTGLDPYKQQKIWVYPIHLETDPQTGEEVRVWGTGAYVLTNAN